MTFRAFTHVAWYLSWLPLADVPVVAGTITPAISTRITTSPAQHQEDGSIPWMAADSGPLRPECVVTQYFRHTRHEHTGLPACL